MGACCESLECLGDGTGLKVDALQGIKALWAYARRLRLKPPVKVEGVEIGPLLDDAALAFLEAMLRELAGCSLARTLLVPGTLLARAHSPSDNLELAMMSDQRELSVHAALCGFLHGADEVCYLMLRVPTGAAGFQTSERAVCGVAVRGGPRQLDCLCSCEHRQYCIASLHHDPDPTPNKACVIKHAFAFGWPV